MNETVDFRAARLRKRRLESQDVWQGALVRLPTWIVGEERNPPYRPWAPIWSSRAEGIIHVGEAKKPEESSPEDVLAALFDFAGRREIDFRPGRIEVADPDLASRLRETLGATDPEIRLAESVDDVKAITALMMEDIVGPAATSSALAAPGVDLALVRSFADAAAGFYRAAPWNHLINEDLVRVENPVDEELGWFSVLGADGQEHGLEFFRSQEDFEALNLAEDPTSAIFDGLWSMDFGPIFEMPIPDADLWSDHGLPVASDSAYPWLARYDPAAGKISRADGEHLAFVEALLRALALTTEDELDSGRWTKTVLTGAGPRDVTLSLPYLLEERSPPESPGDEFAFFDRRLMERSLRDIGRLIQGMDFESVDDMNAFVNERLAGAEVPHPQDPSPHERAQESFYRALDVRGRLRIKLARDALRLSRDCADAWVLLAEHMPDLARRTELYREAMEAGARAHPLERGPDSEHGIWGDIEARPYMRARLGYSRCLVEAGRRGEAIEHWLEMLRLNPGDNQGIRWLAAPALIEAGRLDEAARIVRQFEGDLGCTTAYCGSLLTYARHGDGAEARVALDRALKANPHVPKYLSGKARLPENTPPHFRPGSEDEAMIVAGGLLAPWRTVPGALDWLGERLRDRKRQRKHKRRSGTTAKVRKKRR